MSKVHQWDRLKFVDTSSVCKQCALVVVPKLQVVYGCRNCKFPVHEKCLLEAQTIRPCADVPTRQLISEAVHQGSLKKVAYHNEEKNRPGRPALSSLVSKPGAPKKRFFILVEGYLYYCKSSDSPKPYGVISLSEYSAVAAGDKTQIILTQKEERGSFIMTAASKEEQATWISALDEQLRKPNLTPEALTGFDNYKPVTERKTFNQILVKVTQGRNWKAMDISGTSDCYCIVTCEYGYGRTTTIWGNNVDPFWAESFDFPLDDPETATLTVYAMDEDFMMNDDVIGCIQLPCKNMTKKPTTNWYEIVKCTDVITGYVIFQFTREANNLHVRLVEARNLASADPNGKSDPYVRLSVGKEKKKSSTIHATLNPVFHEDFDFKVKNGVPPVMQVNVYDWDRVGSDDFLGQVEIDFSSFPEGSTVEKRYLLEGTQPLLSPRSAKAKGSLGELKMDTTLICQNVHPLLIYKPLLELLIKPGIPAILLVSSRMVEKEAFAASIIRIFDIDLGVVRLARMLTDHEISSTRNPDIIFRGNTVVTKTMDVLMKMAGHSYLCWVLSPILCTLCHEKNPKPVELDPTRMSKGEDPEKNLARLVSLCSALLDRIFRSVNECPAIIKIALSNIQTKVKQSYSAKEIEVVQYTSVSAFIFLRFFGPAILNPKLFGIVDNMSKFASRACTLLAKVVQNLANLVPFGEKEPHMKALNEFVKENMPRMKEFLDVLCAQGTVLKSQQGERYSQLSPDTWLEKELAMCTVYLDDCREHWFSDENPLSRQLASVVDGITSLDEYGQ